MNKTKLKKFVKESGSAFFNKDSIRFFDSILETPTLKIKGIPTNRYFITSEKFDESFGRLYTIREIQENGHIKTFGRFQQFKQFDDAIERLKEEYNIYPTNNIF